jgi:hypothetical protein
VRKSCVPTSRSSTGARASSWRCLAAILAFAILAWEKASGLSADEKREIGILKAIGWETGDVLKMKFWEGPADLAGGFPDRLPRRLPARLPLLLVAFRPGPQGLGGALPALRTRAR